MRRTYEILSLVIIAEIIGTRFQLSEGVNYPVDKDYCKVRSCAKPLKHTGCKYAFGLHHTGKKCDYSQIFAISLTESERILILERHNEIRQYVAAGREKRGNPGPQPAAYLMPNLTWDDELEVLAQLWANQCTFREDECRNVERFRVGQSTIFDIYSNQSTLPDSVYIESFIDKWYSQVKNFDKGNIHLYASSRYLRTRDYVQIIWADTRVIGCGKIKYQKSDSYIVLLLVCNYGPAGSIDNQNVYEAIEPENENILEKKDISNTNFTTKPNSKLVVNMSNSSAVINIFIH